MFDYPRVIIILPERLGDTLFHTPSIRLLKRCKPDITIGVIALSPLCASVIENNPYIDHIYTLPDQKATRQIARNYDAALNVHNHSGSRQYINWLNLPTLTEHGPDPSRHQSRQSLEFFMEILGCRVEAGDDRYCLFPSAENFKKAAKLLAAQNADPSRDILIGCHIGCHGIAKPGWKFWKPMAHDKVWPLKNFVALEAALRRHAPGFRLVLTGSRAEQKLGKKFVEAAPSTINLIQQTSVLDLAALMESLTLFISSDTGTLHVACASNVGLVGLFGPTDPNRTGPYPMQQKYTVLRAAEVANISVTQVLDAVLSHPDVVRRLEARREPILTSR